MILHWKEVDSKFLDLDITGSIFFKTGKKGKTRLIDLNKVERNLSEIFQLQN